jgi:hypothetical protein
MPSCCKKRVPLPLLLKRVPCVVTLCLWKTQLQNGNTGQIEVHIQFGCSFGLFGVDVCVANFEHVTIRMQLTANVCNVLI